LERLKGIVRSLRLPPPRTLRTFVRAVCAVAFRKRSSERHTDQPHGAKSHLHWFLQGQSVRETAAGCGPDHVRPSGHRSPRALRAWAFPSDSASNAAPSHQGRSASAASAGYLPNTIRHLRVSCCRRWMREGPSGLRLGHRPISSITSDLRTLCPLFSVTDLNSAKCRVGF
jgi:hypothetical protein